MKMQKTYITEILGLAIPGVCVALYGATWWIATDAQSIAGKLQVLDSMATFGGVSLAGAVLRKGAKEVTKISQGTGDGGPVVNQGVRNEPTFG